MVKNQVDVTLTCTVYLNMNSDDVHPFMVTIFPNGSDLSQQSYMPRLSLYRFIKDLSDASGHHGPFSECFYISLIKITKLQQKKKLLALVDNWTDSAQPGVMDSNFTEAKTDGKPILIVIKS